jgi:hypothetical protein
LLFPLCSHLRGVRCDGSLLCSRRNITANALPAADAIRRRRPRSHTDLDQEAGDPRTPPCPRMRARPGVGHSRDGLLLLVHVGSLDIHHRNARSRGNSGLHARLHHGERGLRRKVSRAPESPLRCAAHACPESWIGPHSKCSMSVFPRRADGTRRKSSSSTSRASPRRARPRSKAPECASVARWSSSAS